MGYESLDPGYTLDSFLSDGRYFQSRLAIAKRAAELPASAQFDLARSNISDDQLEHISNQFGGPSPAGADHPGGHSNGFGFSAVLEDLLNRNPRSIPVADLQQYQTNLLARGYISPDTEVTGEWGSEWSSASRRFESDQFQSMVAGQHVAAAPVSSALGILTNTLPSRVFSGIVAQAKSLATELPTTLEHGGLVGGMAEGATVGAAVGLAGGPFAEVTVPVGATVGAVIGGIAGFVADLVGDDKNEPVDQSLMGNFLDSLSPYEEYVKSPEGAKNFFHDIGWVANASSAVLGAGAIGSGLKAAAGAVGAARTGSMGAAVAAPELVGAGARVGSELAPAALETAPTALEAGTKTTLQALMARTAPAESGAFTRMAAWVTRRAGFEDAAQSMVEFVGKYGPRAQKTRPLIQGIESVYSGLSESQMGARYTAGLGAGSGSLNREIAGFEEQLRENVDEKGAPLDPRVRPAIEQRLAELKQTRAQSETPEEQAFRTAPVLPGAFYVDQLAWILQPTHFFPLRTSAVVQAFEGLTSDASLLSYGKVIQGLSTTPMGLGQALKDGRAALGDTPAEQSLVNTWLRRNFGVDAKAAEMVAGADSIPVEGGSRLAALKSARGKVIRDLQAEREAGGVELATSLVQRSVDDPTKFETWLMHNMSHTGVGGLGEYVQAERSLAQVSSDVRQIWGEQIALTQEFTDAGLDAKNLIRSRSLSLEDMASSLRNRGIDVELSESQGVVKLSKIVVPEAERGKGLGTGAMNDLTSWADANGKTLALSASEDFGGTKSRLVSFYKGFGFKANTGKARDLSISEAMIRPGALEESQVAALDKLQASMESHRLPELSASQNWEREAISEQMSGLREQALKLERKARTVIDPKEKASLEGQAAGDRKLATELESELETLPRTTPRSPDNTLLASMRIENMHSGELHAKATELEKLNAELKELNPDVTEAINLFSEDIARPVLARESINQQNILALVDDLARRGFVPSRISRDLRESFTTHTVGKAIKDLRESAKYTATDASGLVPLETLKELEALGYKPVITGGDMLFVDDVQKFGALIPADFEKQIGIAGKLRLHEFGVRAVDKIGLREIPNETIGELRKVHEEAELDVVAAQLEREGVPIGTGKGIRSFLAEKIKEIATSSPKVSIGVTAISKRIPQALGDLSVREIEEVFAGVPGFDTNAAVRVMHAIKRGQAFGGELKLKHPIESARDLGRAIGVQGLPGFSDLIRTYQLPSKGKLIVGGTAVGAAYGGLTTPGDVEAKFKGALKDAVLGGVTGGGLALLAFSRGGYGYLPDRLAKLNNYMRYTLSATFDAGRYLEQNLIAGAKEGGKVPMFLRPERYITRHDGLLSPFSGETVQGKQAWDESLRFWDQLNGGTKGYISVRAIDDMERRFSQVGILGFDPRKFEAAQAMLLFSSTGGKLSSKALLDRVLELGRYGPGQTNIEKSLNFIFFPFMYSKKIITTAGDWILQEPARALLLHDAMKAYDASKFDEDFHRIVEDKLPILRELAQITNFGVYGLSPGRFFLQGLGGRDTRTTEARVMQGLASFFIPSGAAQPLARVAGQAGDLAMHMFTPQAFTGGSFQRAGGFEGMEDILRAYVPSIRDVTQWWTAIKDSATGLLHGETPYAQLQDYQDGLREVDSHQELIAKAMGYSTASGLRSSASGAMFQRQYDETKAELQKKYPQGSTMEMTFASPAVRDIELRTLSEKADHDSPEELIVRMAADEASTKRTAELLGMPSSFVMRMLTSRLRALALQHVDDPRFLELYDTYFAYTYGPISRIAAAA